MLSKISYLRGNLVGMLRVTVKVGKKNYERLLIATDLRVRSGSPQRTRLRLAAGFWMSRPIIVNLLETGEPTYQSRAAGLACFTG